MAAAYSGKGGVAKALYWSLVSLNHRGQQSYGILTYASGGFRYVKGLGPVPERMRLEKLEGGVGLGHVRYATSGGWSREQMVRDAQPCVAEWNGRRLALAYNGNVANAAEEKRSLERRGVRLSCSSDAEIIAYELLLGMDDGLLRAASRLASRIDGAYSLVALTGDGVLMAIRDPVGLKPLFYGRGEGLLLVASETVAHDVNGLPAEPVRPGELLVVSGGAVEKRIFARGSEKLCAFEYAYFARPDSRLDGRRYVYEVRRELGRRLARRYRELTSRVDVVVPVPETAVDAAYGFHEESGKPVEPLVVRQRFVRQRAFMASPGSRKEILSMKYNVVRGRARGKSIALIDDSIVRGDTLRSLVKALREAGAREIHVFSTFPKIVGPCFYGVDMASYGELIGFGRDEEEIARLLGADSVNYQTAEDFEAAVGGGVCLACVTGRYPTPHAALLARIALEKSLRAGRITEVVG